MLSSLCGHCLPSCQAERQAPGLFVHLRNLVHLMLSSYWFYCVVTFISGKAPMPVVAGKMKQDIRVPYFQQHTGLSPVVC